jgi:hypothetical protein
MQVSQGIFSPPLITITSPGTINLASTDYTFPSLMTVAIGGMKFSNYAIISADFEVYIYEKHPVKNVTTASTTPK